MFFLAYAMEKANVSNDDIDDEIACLLSSSETGKGLARARKLCLPPPPPPRPYPAILLSRKKLCRCRPRPRPLCLPASFAGQDAVKLATLFERKPCELKLFGRRVSSGDVATAVAAVALLQVFCLLGLDWLVDP